MAFDPKSKDGKKVLSLMDEVFKQLNSSWQGINQEASKIHQTYSRYKAFRDALVDNENDLDKIADLFQKKVKQNKDLVRRYNTTRKMILAGKGETIE